MASPIFEGFSVSHAAILNGTTGAEAQQIYGVQSGSIAVDSSSFDNTGDDVVLSTWSWFTYATLTISSGYIPFDTVSLITGAPITSSGTAPNDYWSMDLWRTDSLNQPQRPVLIRVPAKDNSGNPRSIDFILYKVQFDPIKFTGPQYKNGLVLDYGGKALISQKDEVGNTLATPAIGRVVYRPRVQDVI